MRANVMKRCVISLISKLSFWMGLTHFFYWLNRDRKRVITFHNVLPKDLFKINLTNGVSDSDESFRRIIREIKKRFNFSVDLEDSKTVTITFDDGYLNQYEIAGRILQEEGNIPAILFVAGDLLDNGTPERALVVDQLLHWVAYAPCGMYKLTHLDGTQENFCLEVKKRGVVWGQIIRPAYVKDVEGRGRGLLKQLDEQYSIEKIYSQLPAEYKRLRLTGITSEQVDKLRSHGWKVGWHTKSHFPLSALSEADKQEEIMPLIGFKDTVFSYPYGELLSVDNASIKIVEACGYPCAVSNLLERGKLNGLYFLPRMALMTNKYRLHFRLSGLEYFLKYRKRLPLK